MDIKSKVLDEIIELMENEDAAKLKKHPKFMAAKIEVLKPKEKIEGVEDMEGEKIEKPEIEIEEPELKAEDEDELDEETIQKLAKLIK